jgi:aspartokinase
MLLNNSMPKEVKNYFDPRAPSTLINDANKIITFQKDQSRLYVAKQYGNRGTFNSYKTKYLEMESHKKKIVQAMTREKAIVNRLKHAYQ